MSLGFVEAIHRGWVIVLRGMDESAMARTMRHAELGEIRLDANIGLYAWHGRHHVAHILMTREREG